MGFFKDFKDDVTQAVNELLPEEELMQQETEDDQIVNTLDSEEPAIEETENDNWKEWLDDFTQKAQPEESLEQEDELAEVVDNILDETKDEVEIMEDNVDLELLEALNAADDKEELVEEKSVQKAKVTVSEDDVTVITKGTTINGSISSDGSLDVMGSITGDIECLGKLSITGKVVGNSTASEVFVNTERLTGSINSEGSVKVGLGTVIVGDIAAASGVIAGAVKGEIDINGPIVIDSTAIIKGNIKAKSVQINNGAVIEGFCSLSYASVDVDNIFE